MLNTVAIGGHQFGAGELARVVGVVVAGMFIFHRLLRGGLKPLNAALLQASVLAGGAISGHLLLVVIRMIEGLSRGRIIHPTWTGLTILGAIAGGAATGVLFLRWRHLPVGATLDLGVLPVPLGLFFARLGCMFSGCCYGKTTSSWLGVALPGAGGLVQRRFPAQAIASGVNLAVFLILVVLDLRGTRRGRLAPGSLVWSFFALHCFQRFFLEWLRDTSIPVFLSLTVPQILCAVGFVLSVVILVRINRYPVADD